MASSETAAGATKFSRSLVTTGMLVALSDGMPNSLVEGIEHFDFCCKRHCFLFVK